MKRAVGYALDSKPLYWRLLELSLESLRRHSPLLPVYVFAHGPVVGGAKRFERRYGATVVQRAALVDPNLAWGLKWNSVGDVPAESTLFLDVDTYFYDAPEVLFEKYRVNDFYARREIAFGRDERHGPLLLRDRLDGAAYERFAIDLGGIPVPVFNGGVTLWNRKAHQRWRAKIELFNALTRMLIAQNGVLKLMRRGYFVDEVAAGLCLGTLKRFKWGTISKGDSPWYSEWKFGIVRKKGVVMHVNTAYAKQWVKQEFVEQASRRKLLNDLGRLARRSGVRFLNLDRLKKVR